MKNLQLLPINKLIVNKENPRIIKDEKFEKLISSIKNFPKMLELRPIIVNKDMVIIGGNMRYKAAKEAGLKKIPTIIADHLTEAEQHEFIVKDNLSAGEWDWEMIMKDWDDEALKNWGMDIFSQQEIDLSLLELGNDEKADALTKNVTKAIQIEFKSKDYGDAYELTQKLREKKVYIGGIVLEALKKHV